jgi:hypothetical protein
MNLEPRVEAIGFSIQRLVRDLRRCGYRFERPAEVLPGPEAGTSEAIARIEREAGELPLVLKLFWLKVGSVDLCGHHPDWRGCDYPDPLVVTPPWVALDELDAFLDDREERLRHDFPYLVPIAPDFYHKADVSGGMYYNISVPAVADDPPLNDEWNNTTLLGYLEEAIRWSGFPGLARCPGHSWPIPGPPDTSRGGD